MNKLVLAIAFVSSSADLNLRAALHVHTSFSDGRHSVEEVAGRAARAGIDAVLLNDHFMEEIAYGPPLLREALAFRVRVRSLSPGDMESYFAAANEAERRTGVMVLPGVELTPFYFWEGSLLTGDLTLRSADRHLLVVFPDQPGREDLSEALVTVNAPAARKLGLSSLILLWPLLPGLWAARRLLRPPLAVKRTRYFILKIRRRPGSAWALAGGCLAALVLSWPFTLPRWSPYEGDAGLAPYQFAVDAAVSRGGLTFWAHPETTTLYRHPTYPARYDSRPYPEFIAQTKGATGFASLYEGYRQVANPGGFWDGALADFCRGNRRKPVWTVGEISLHEEGEAGGKFFGEVETVARVRERSHRALIQALESGAMYAIWQRKRDRLLLERFRVSSDEAEAEMGERLASSGPRRVEVRLRREGRLSAPVELTLIRNGQVAWQDSVEVGREGVALSWRDESLLPGLSYYRLAGKGEETEMFFSNPVFVSPQEAAR